AVWIWGQTVREQGAEQVAERLAAARIDTALVLIKGLAGRTSFASSVAIKPQPGVDVLGELLKACHPRGIRVEAWVMFHGDSEWVKAHPDEAAHSCGLDPNGRGPTRASDEKVCPAAPGYRDYLKRLMRGLATDYPVDGLHLDGIRYPSLASCFCERHRAKAKAAGIDFEKVRQAAAKSVHQPAARDHYVQLYQQGDTNIKAWVDLRREEIDSFVRETAELLKATRPTALLSAALMPEGAEDNDAFALCHYAQDYRTIGQACDYICPMSYHASFDKPAIWPADVAARAMSRSGHPVLAGIQAFDPSTPAHLGEALGELERRNLPGFVLFSYNAMTSERWAQLGK
ncbi:MAG: family 10 glycosylhydrolase, partial [Armatimonadetes bacterium]|nr:family 10 glycosylhydrolase [Armatimonadota bacterium]